MINMKFHLIAGARPNFLKISSIINAIIKSKHNINYKIIHTGQHFDKNLSEVFFNQLNIFNGLILFRFIFAQ